MLKYKTTCTAIVNWVAKEKYTSMVTKVLTHSTANNFLFYVLVERLVLRRGCQYEAKQFTF